MEVVGVQTFMRGFVAGFTGTVAMTAVITVEVLTGLMREEPAPETVSAHAEEAVGLREHLPEPAFQVSWLMQHFGYGTNGGVGYALARRFLPVEQPVLAGMMYGIALYLIGYAGWLPVLHLYPLPQRNPRRKVAMLVAEHLVYGTTTALVYQALSAQAAAAE